jgi:hypothetical protein
MELYKIRELLDHRSNNQQLKKDTVTWLAHISILCDGQYRTSRHWIYHTHPRQLNLFQYTVSFLFH